MTKPKAKIKIRSMTLEDFDVIFSIDQQIRAMRSTQVRNFSL
jgi:hypothetical protein